MRTLSKTHEALGNMKNLQSQMFQQDIGPSQNSLKAKKTKKNLKTAGLENNITKKNERRIFQSGKRNSLKLFNHCY